MKSINAKTAGDLMKVSSAVVALCECIFMRSEDTEHCLIAGGAVQDGWTFLDVRPPHETAKVHPAATGCWRVRGMRRLLMLDQLSTGRASKPQGNAECSEGVAWAWRARRRACRARRRCRCTSWTRSGARRWC